MKPLNTKLKVVLFSGGRGTGSISDALLKYSDIELVSLVNAYDDGLSTGLLRRFIPGMLGPSDIRKVVSGLLKHKSDRSSQALRKLLEYRLPDEITTNQALRLIESLIHWEEKPKIQNEILDSKESLSLHQMRQVSELLQAFLTYYQKNNSKRSFTFSDNSLGNLIFGGCYLLSNNDFNKAIDRFSQLAETEGQILNITQGENCALVAVKADGRYLFDEASIVGPQDSVPIEEIFLLPEYLDRDRVEFKQDKEAIIQFLRKKEKLPRINPRADKALRQADIIIYGPGTQHSSLLPSYLTIGVAEAIKANTRAEKIFIANIARDNDIMAASANTLVNEFMWNMSRKDKLSVRGRSFFTRFFFQKPEKNSESVDYVPFNENEFNYPLDRVVWVDLEGDTGKHSGGKTVTELLLIVEEQLRRRIKHVPHKVSIVVPALNEARTIYRVIKKLQDVALPKGLEKEIIVIDGGSNDQTYTIARNTLGIRSYQVANPSGRGQALRLGIEKAKGDIIVFFPSDDEYNTADIARILEPLLQGGFPAVLGSRAFSQDLSGTLQQVYGHKGLLFVLSKYGGMLLSIMTLLFYHRYISDPLTSVKAFNARVFRGMKFQKEGVDFDMELLARIAKAKYSILEVPVSYTARTIKQGKKITVWDGLKCIITLIQFSRLKPVQPKRSSNPEPASQSLTTRVSKA